MQTHLKRNSACFALFLFAMTCGAAAQSSSVSAGVDGGIAAAPNTSGSGDAPDSSISGVPHAGGKGGAGYALFGAGGHAFNSKLQTADQKMANGLITHTASGPSSYGKTSIQSRAAMQTGMTQPSAALAASPSTSSLPHASSGGGGQYSSSFPDSATGRAVLSPPFAMGDALFGFTPSLSTSFEDLNTKQFLNPDLHVEMSVKSKKQKADLFQKLEGRRKNKKAPKDSIFSRKKKSPFEKQSGLDKEQQGLKSDSTLDDRNF
jgi:hypothetical protein